MSFDYVTKVDQICTAFEKVQWEDPKIYGAYLKQLNSYVCHSTRLLALAASRFPLSEEKVHKRFLTHTAEEKGHEVLAERDCQKIGFSIHDFPELASTRAFYQVQYYQIEHVSPWAFFGYIIALESLAERKCRWLYEVLEKHHGPGSASFMKVHAEEDPDHIAQAIKMIESRNSSEITAIRDSLEISTYLLVQMVNDLPVAASKFKNSRARQNAA